MGATVAIKVAGFDSSAVAPVGVVVLVALVSRVARRLRRDAA